MVCCYCQAAKVENESWDRKLREWVDEVNSKFLAKNGMLLKTQSRRDVQYVSENTGGEGGGTNTRKERYIERWLSIALTPEEAAILASEPNLIGDTESHTDCGGDDERDYIMHP